ncbi:MAG: hypothetical protein OXM61_23170 [Candidatus Poribacteria bacterium]|nr:hypothetical protein [Candidatus Poribacteria bacterium]
MTRMTLLALIFGIVMSLGCGDVHLCLEEQNGQDGLVTTTVGMTNNDTLYELGVVLVSYGSNISRRSGTIVPPAETAVDNFFIRRGYTPKVIGFPMYHNFEVIYIGEEVDTLPFLKKLESIPGVNWANTNKYNTTFDLISADYEIISELLVADDDWKEPPRPKKAGLVEVGTTEDGLLYELGTVIVRYNKEVELSLYNVSNSPTVAAVVDFFIGKRYEPTVKETLYPIDYNLSGHNDTFYFFQLIEVGECVDTAPMLAELRAIAIPGVSDVYLNVLQSTATRWSGNMILPATH